MKTSDLMIMLAAAGALLFVVVAVTKKKGAAARAAGDPAHASVYASAGMYGLPVGVPIDQSNPFGVAAL